MLKDADLYTRAMKEFSSGQVNEDLKTKSLVLAYGDKEVAKFQYIRLRVEQLKREGIKRLPGNFALGALRGIQAFDSRKLRLAERGSRRRKRFAAWRDFGKKKSEIAGAQLLENKAALRHFIL